MSLKLEEVKKIAHLARIKITEDQANQFTKEINKIFDFVEQLKEVDTDGVEPLFSVSDHDLPLRDDVINDGNIREEILHNAPNSKYDHFSVTKVVE